MARRRLHGGVLGVEHGASAPATGTPPGLLPAGLSSLLHQELGRRQASLVRQAATIFLWAKIKQFQAASKRDASSAPAGHDSEGRAAGSRSAAADAAAVAATREPDTLWRHPCRALRTDRVSRRKHATLYCAHAVGQDSIGNSAAAASELHPRDCGRALARSAP